jgi:hypothetical protein
VEEAMVLHDLPVHVEVDVRTTIGSMGIIFHATEHRPEFALISVPAYYLLLSQLRQIGGLPGVVLRPDPLVRTPSGKMVIPTVLGSTDEVFVPRRMRWGDMEVWIGAMPSAEEIGGEDEEGA